MRRSKEGKKREMDRRLKKGGEKKRKTEGEVFPSFEAVAQGHSLP